MRAKTRALALGGVLTALAAVLLTLGGLVPLAVYCGPMLAMVVLLPVELEYGRRPALAAYGAVSALGLLLAADREAALVYVFFGFYPILRPALERLPSRPLRLAAKLTLWTALGIGLYAFLLFVLGLRDTELASHGAWYGWTLLGLADVSLLLLDTVLGRMSALWRKKWRRRFF